MIHVKDPVAKKTFFVLVPVDVHRVSQNNTSRCDCNALARAVAVVARYGETLQGGWVEPDPAWNTRYVCYEVNARFSKKGGRNHDFILLNAHLSRTALALQRLGYVFNVRTTHFANELNFLSTGSINGPGELLL